VPHFTSNCIKCGTSSITIEELFEEYKNMKVKKITKSFCHTYDINVPDVHNYILENGLVSHNSTIAAGTTNGPYPIRETYIMKTNDTLVNHWAAPDGTKLKSKYQSAWDISTTDMIKFYAILQKWTDQAISADLYVKIHGDSKVSSSSMIQDYLDMVKFGVKTRYYVNSSTSAGVDLNKEETAVNIDTTNDDDQDGSSCESCTL
jgi:ribonucleoside-diphosphate reductase alpha chain